MADWIINVVAFLGTLLGIFMVTGAPYVQKQITKGKTLELLEMKRPSELTEDEKWTLEQLRKPFKFNQYYIWTALGGFFGALVAVLASINTLFTSTASVTNWTVAFALGVTFGVTGNWIGNQLVKSETPSSVVLSQTGSTKGPTTSQVTDKVKGAIDTVTGKDEVQSTP